MNKSKLETKKKLFCKGSNQLDLSNVNVKNIAIYYLKDEISKHYKNHMISVKKQIRYNVVDKSCPSALFDAKDFGCDSQKFLLTRDLINECLLV